MDGGLELCTEGSNQNYPKRRSARKQWLPEDVLNQLRKEEKAREKGKYTQLNAEFQRIARRDKKACLNEQCREIEENNRIGKTRISFKNW